LIFLLEVDKSPMQITTLHWQGGCYWRKQRFHRENAFFWVWMLQIYFDRIEITAPGAMQRARNAALRHISQAAMQAAKTALPTAGRAHPAPEEAGLTPRQHTAFAS
jgi:hypothetical protein